MYISITELCVFQLLVDTDKAAAKRYRKTQSLREIRN